MNLHRSYSPVIQGSVADYGEQALLSLLHGFCAPGMVGDDGAIVPWNNASQSLVVTTDVLVEGVHFSEQTTPAAAAGWRSVAANLSDLAAMGADPLGITIGLGLPKSCAVQWVLELYQGITHCLDRFGGKTCLGILGGDLCRSPVVSVAITALGLVQPQQIIRRSGLKIGDQLVVTGCHGASRAGLEILQHPHQETLLTLPHAAAWVRAHQYPVPRFDALLPLRSFSASCPTMEFAGMDSSDGLGDAIYQLCRASGVSAHIDRQCLPLPEGLVDWIGLEQALDWALYGGEDFELVLGLPPEWAEPFVQTVEGARTIGVIIPNPEQGTEVMLWDSTGASPPRSLTLAGSFQHFS